MATAITYADVTNGFTTSVPEAEVALYITVIDQADTCLDANSVASDVQKALKIAGVRHMLVLAGASASGKGAVTSESAPSGASRSYKAPDGGSGLMATSYGALLKQLDKHGCVVNQIENQVRQQIRSIGRKYPDNE